MKLRFAKYPTLRAEIRPAGIVFEYDPVADVAYIQLGKGTVADTREFTHNIWADYSRRGRLLGLEIANPKRLDRTAFTRIAARCKTPVLARLHPEILARGLDSSAKALSP